MESRPSVKKYASARTLIKPTSHIGAQALLCVSGCSHSGFLAKRGRRERLLERFNLPNKPIFNDIKKWRKRFVVIAQGCIYIYDKNTSNNINQAFSLAGFNRLYKMDSDRGDFPFRLEGRYNGMKEYQFSCTTDEDRKEWMKQIKNEMCIANDVEPECDDSDYRTIEKPVIVDDDDDDDDDKDDDDSGSNDSDYDEIPDSDVMPRSKMPLPPTPVDRRDSESTKTKSLPGAVKKKEPQIQEKRKVSNIVTGDKKTLPSQSSENKTLPTQGKGKRPVPKTEEKKPAPKPEEKKPPPKPEVKKPAPKPEVKKTAPVTEAKKAPVLKEKRTIPQPPVDDDEADSSSGNEKPKPKPKPTEKPVVNKVKKTTNGVPTEKEYLFHGSNREEAIQKLKKGPPGTFLVRSSRTDESKVLVVNTPDDVKEFKIYKQGEKVTLDKKSFYKSTQELIETYSKNNLPKRDIPLGRGYSSLDLTAI